jgi:hypothetical protein
MLRIDLLGTLMRHDDILFGLASMASMVAVVVRNVYV